MNSRLEQSCRTLKRVSALAALMAASLVGRAEEFTVLQGGGALDITDRSLTSSSISNGTNLGPIQRVRANLSGLTHTDPDDLDVLLVFERDIIANNNNETRRETGYT